MEDDIIVRARKMFSITEVVDPATYHQYGEGAWSLLHPELLETIMALKDFFKEKQIVMNTWNRSVNDQRLYGFFSERGFRDPNCPTGAKRSAHKRGKAIDFDVWEGARRLEPSAVRKQVMENIALFPHIKAEEVNINWLHFDILFDLDCRPQQVPGEIYVFDAHGFLGNKSRKVA